MERGLEQVIDTALSRLATLATPEIGEAAAAVARIVLGIVRDFVSAFNNKARIQGLPWMHVAHNAPHTTVLPYFDLLLVHTGRLTLSISPDGRTLHAVIVGEDDILVNRFDYPITVSNAAQTVETVLQQWLGASEQERS